MRDMCSLGRRNNEVEGAMSKDPTQKISHYIATLEDTNEELLKSLKYSVKVLKAIKPSAPNPQKW